MLVLFSLLLLTSQSSSPGFRPVRSVAVHVFAPVMNAGSVINDSTARAIAGVFAADRVRQENEALRAELARLRSERAASSTRVTELESAVVLGESLPEISTDVRAARVVAPVPDGTTRRLWVDLGNPELAEEGQTVLGPRGVIGRVREVHGRHAIVQLLTDAESQWGGESAERSEGGVVHGTGDDDRLRFRLERTTTRLQPGDEVVTSGLRGSTVPAGLPLGVVREVIVDETGERHAVLDLMEEVETLRHVYLLPEQQFAWQPPS